MSEEPNIPILLLWSMGGTEEMTFATVKTTTTKQLNKLHLHLH